MIIPLYSQDFLNGKNSSNPKIEMRTWNKLNKKEVLDVNYWLLKNFLETTPDFKFNEIEENRQKHFEINNELIEKFLPVTYVPSTNLKMKTVG